MRTDVIEDGHRTGRHALVLLARWLDYCFGLLYALLGIRLVLEFLDARSTAGFTRFITTVTDPFYNPFKAIVRTDALPGGEHLVWPLVVAILAYMLLHAALRGLIRLAERA